MTYKVVERWECRVPMNENTRLRALMDGEWLHCRGHEWGPVHDLHLTCVKCRKSFTIVRTVFGDFPRCEFS